DDEQHRDRTHPCRRPARRFGASAAHTVAASLPPPTRSGPRARGRTASQTSRLFGCDGGDTIAAPPFDPQRLSHACGTMQFAVSFYLFPVICAVQQIVLIDLRDLERDHH